MRMGQQLREISELCQELGVTLILCHHTTKGAGADHKPINLTDVAWSGFAEFCRQWILINHREKYDPETGIHHLWLQAGGSAGHSGLWELDIEQGHQDRPGGRYWIANVMTRDKAKTLRADQRREQQGAQDQQKIIAAMRELEQEHPEGNAKTAIYKKANLNSATFDSAIVSLVKNQQVVECQFKRSNWKKKQPGYKLKEVE